MPHNKAQNLTKLQKAEDQLSVNGPGRLGRANVRYGLSSNTTSIGVR
jgi:hypothetical protein